MSCHGCAVKFGAFTKEHGCPNCGFSYCKKCLRFKTVVPKLGVAVQNVCRNCYEILSNNQKEDVRKEQQSPPAVFLRKLESLENPSKPPITVYHHNSRMEKLKTGLQPEDQEIVDRLEKLKEERKRQREVIPTEEDIVRRLAALKGDDSDQALERRSERKEIFNLPDTRSDEEKTNDLIKQLIQEQILSVKCMSADDLIARRLARLREQNIDNSIPKRDEINIEESAAGNEATNIETSTDEVKELMKQVKAHLGSTQRGSSASNLPAEAAETEDNKNIEEEREVQEVVKKIMAEAALDELEESESKESSDEQEEQPWCIVCNEDATKSCPQCDDDIFCDKCFAEFHSDPDIKDHCSVPFVHKKKA